LNINISKNKFLPEIFFRLDAGPKHGLGHFSRCYNLAKIFKKNKFKIHFICSKESKKFFLDKNCNFINFIFIQKKGFNPEEIKKITNKIKDSKTKPILVVDSKEKIKNYLHNVKNLFFIVCFDDEDYRDLKCNIIINNNINANNKSYFLSNNRKLLIGPKFNLIESRFFKKKKIKKEVKKVTISFGGEDPKNYTLIFLKNYYKLFKNIRISIILGPAHPDINSIKSFLRSHALKANLFINPKSMYNLLKTSDLAISACGTTVYELGASRVPCIVIAIEKHQLKLLNFLKKTKCIESLNLNSNNYSKNY